jgi:hypothetical protein
VYDVSDPADPALLARWRDSYGAGFWTAEPAGDRGFFVAPSWKGRDDEGVFAFDHAALYTFSDPAATPSATPTALTSSDGQPGFGPLAGLAGLGAGAWYALARRRRRGSGPVDRRS